MSSMLAAAASVLCLCLLKLLQFIEWGTWMCGPNPVPIQSVFVKTFQLEPNLQTSRHCHPYSNAASMAK